MKTACPHRPCSQAARLLLAWLGEGLPRCSCYRAGPSGQWRTEPVHPLVQGLGNRGSQCQERGQGPGGGPRPGLARGVRPREAAPTPAPDPHPDGAARAQREGGVRLQRLGNPRKSDSPTPLPEAPGEDSGPGSSSCGLRPSCTSGLGLLRPPEQAQSGLALCPPAGATTLSGLLLGDLWLQNEDTEPVPCPL